MTTRSATHARVTLLGALARGQVVWLLLIVTVWSVWLLLLPMDPDYTAGELLDHLLRWQETGQLYVPLGEDPPLRVMNYPPLVFVFARGLMVLGMPALLAGRLVNGLAVVLLVWVVGWWTRARGARGGALVGTVGLLGASFPVIYGAGQFHVEMWAVLATVTGFALADQGRGGRQLALAGVALAAACLAKQTQVVPAFVGLAWLALHRRSDLKPALLGFVITGLAGVSAISLAFGAEAWRHMLSYTVGTISLSNLGWQLLSHVAPWFLLLLVAAWRGAARGSDQRGDAAWWYWCGAFLWSLSAVRQGSGYPYFLDLHVATVVLAGPWVFREAAGWSSGWVGRVLPWALAVQIVGANVGVAVAVGLNIDRIRRVDAYLLELCAEFDPSGLVLTEEAGLARACGRIPAIHPFITTSLAAQGRWDPGSFERWVASGSLGPALIPFDPREPVTGAHAERWTLPVLAAFAEAPSVRPHASGWWVVRW